MIPAHADTAAAPAAAPAVSGLLGAVDGGLLGGVVQSLFYGQGGLLGPDGGVIAGSNDLGDVVGGFGDAVADPQIGGEGSFGGAQSPVGGLLGGLLSNGVGLLGGVL